MRQMNGEELDETISEEENDKEKDLESWDEEDGFEDIEGFEVESEDEKDENY